MLKISVVMPSYNQAKFIGRAIDSVLSQCDDFETELLVIDGGSTDSTRKILESYGDGIHWVSEADRGQADALNKGLALAAGDVIGWLNSDDLYEPGAFATVARIFGAEPQTKWLYGKARIIDASGREIRSWITWYKNHRMRRYRYSKLLTENWISQMGVFWRRTAGLRVGPFDADLHYCMDYDYWLRLGALWPGRFVDQYLAAFRWYPTSKSGAGFSKQFREQLQVARRIAAGRYAWPVFLNRINCIRTVTVYSLMRMFRECRRKGIET